jgi:Na+/melibiose symporter-like transporter
VCSKSRASTRDNVRVFHDQHDVRRLIGAEGVSNFGSMLSRLAIPWVATLMLGAGPASMALLVVADVIAAALGAVLLGPLIDASRKRVAMLWCDGLRALVLAAVAWGAWRGVLSVPWLVAAAAAGGLLTVAFELARSAWVAQTVAQGELPRVNSRLAVASSLSETAAFAAGGWLYQALGAALALVVDALSYLCSALLLRGVCETSPAAAPASPASPWQHWWQEQREGWQVLLSHPALRSLMVVQALRALGFSLAGTSYMVYVTQDLALPTSIQGMVFALGGVGAVVGATCAPRLGQRCGAGAVMSWGLLLAALGAACVALASGTVWVAVALLAAHQIIGDGGDTLYEVHDRTLRQTAVGEAWLARVDAGIRAATQCATLAGAALGALLGTWASARAVLVMSALVFAMAALWAGLTLARRPLQSAAQ